MTVAGHAKFDADRAGEYLVQSRIGLAGYDACHELTACILAAMMGSGRSAEILVAGAGGSGNEIVVCGGLEPGWRFTAVDPSAPMMALAMGRVEAAGLSGRTRAETCLVGDLPADAAFDAATLIGVLHHVPGDEAKRAILADIAARLKPGAPFILAGNYRAYAAEPLLLEAWSHRWRMNGADEAEVRAKQGRILEGADPPVSEAAVADMLTEAGFAAPERFFNSLFWGAWATRRRA